MGIRKDTFNIGEFYHVYNRGNSKQNIFLTDQDRDRFAKLLYLCNSDKKVRFKEDIVDRRIDAWKFERGEPLVSIGAWVLMPNHFHLYITPSPRRRLGDEESLSLVTLFLHKLSTAYSMYFNKKYSRTGSLFEGPFKSVRAASDRQTKYTFSYIHLNPIKLTDSLWKKNGLKNLKKSKSFLDTYKWSSYHDYRGVNRPENKILDKEAFPEYFLDKDIFDKEIFDWLTFPKASPWGDHN